MIVSNVKDIDLKMFSYSKNLTTAFKFIKENDLSKLPLGKTFIDGNEVYLNKMNYVAKNFEDAKLEGHEKYLDIQLVLEGEEKIGYVDKNKKGIKVKQEYNEEKDVSFYESELDAIVKLDAGYFVLVLPNDLHQPSIKTSDNSVTKVVFKVKIDF